MTKYNLNATFNYADGEEHDGPDLRSMTMEHMLRLIVKSLREGEAQGLTSVLLTITVDQLQWEMLHPKMTLRHLGYIPGWLSPSDPKSAREQLSEGYKFGGWQPFKGFTLNDDNSLSYPGDPPIKPLAKAQLRDETIVFYDHSWVAVIQKDRSFEVCRMD